MAAMTDAFENKLQDFLFRGQALGLANSTAGAGTGPSSWFFGLLTVLPTDSSAGTEVTGGSYARVSVASALASWKGTHASATGVSSGTSATVTNAAIVQFAAPTANWGSVQGMGLYDSLTGGLLCIYSPLGAAKTVNNGDAAPSFPIDAFGFQLDN